MHLCERAVATLSANHEVRLVDLYGEQVAAPGDALAWAEGLVLVYPTWWSSQPAPLLDWFDACWSARERRTGLRSITVVSPHGSSWWVNVIEGEVGRRVVMRGLRRRAAARCKGRWVGLYDMDRSTPEQRAGFAARMERKLARLR